MVFSTNLAIIPGSNEAVRATTIRPGIDGQCAARNIDFFDKINGEDDPISFHGQTKSLIAESTVIPGETYTIKLVISDNQDSQVDSAVFLQAGSFALGYDLGEDRTVANGNPACNGERIPLDVTVEGVQDYRWYKDGNQITEWIGEPEVTLTESGTYRVDLVFSASCISEGGLEVEFIVPPKIEVMPENTTACDIDGDGSETFDLTTNGLRMLGDQDATIYKVTYFASEADASAFVNPLENTDSYLAGTTETIYARISSGKSCYEIAPFQIQVQRLDFETSLETTYTLCLDAEGNILEPLPTLDTGLPSSEYSFRWYRETIAPESRIEVATGPSYAASAIGIYHVVLVNLNYGCEFSIATTVSVSQQPESFEVQFLSDLFTNNNVIEIAAEGNSDYLYAVDDQDFGVSNHFDNLTAGEHTAFITDVDFCSVQAQEFLVVDFPRFFTPNGDGTNDIWQIAGIPEIENAEITIFDQYGSLLYQFENDGGWDGTVNNIRMPVNDYWFKIRYVKDDVQNEFKSHFSLKR